MKRVLPQHTDHAGVMWHGAYVSWLEEARVEALSIAGLPYMQLTSQGFEMPVVNLQIKYIMAPSHGDEVVMESLCLPRQGVRFPWETVFLKSGKDLIARAEVDLVLVKVDGKSRKILRNLPLQVEEALIKLSKGP